jgi:energy-converting hydrogenase Eha subunit F
MNRKQSAAALSVLAMAGIILMTTEASAMYKDPEPWAMHLTQPGEGWPDEGAGYPVPEPTTTEYNYPNYDPKYEVPPAQVASVTRVSDDNGVEVLQSGASALGGAAVAMGAMWFYRRRHFVAG